MNWYEKRASDLAHIKNFHERSHARADFKVNESVRLGCDLSTADGIINQSTNGVIAEVRSDGSYVVDFGPKGRHHFTNEAAGQNLYVVRNSDMRSSIRKAMNSRVDESFTPGHRVKDANGHQYFIEKTDVFGRTFQCLDESGNTKVFSKYDLAPMDEAEPFTGNLAMAPGSRVTVQGINPELNNIRARAILPAEAPGIIGQTGILGFAYYPTGTGTQMYRVILQSGGMKDFSMEELGPAGMAEALIDKDGTAQGESNKYSPKFPPGKFTPNKGGGFPPTHFPPKGGGNKVPPGKFPPTTKGGGFPPTHNPPKGGGKILPPGKFPPNKEGDDDFDHGRIHHPPVNKKGGNISNTNSPYKKFQEGLDEIVSSVSNVARNFGLTPSDINDGNGGIQAVYRNESPKLSIFKVNSNDALKPYAKGTKWDLGTDHPSSQRYFDGYNESGPIFLIKNDDPKGKKYLFHPSTGVLVDENDKPHSIDHPNFADLHLHLKNLTRVAGLERNAKAGYQG